MKRKRAKAFKERQNRQVMTEAKSAEDIVKWAYMKVLGRAPDDQGKATYVDKVASGVLNQFQLAQALQRSDESKAKAATAGTFDQATIDGIFNNGPYPPGLVVCISDVTESTATPLGSKRISLINYTHTDPETELGQCVRVTVSNSSDKSAYDAQTVVSLSSLKYSVPVEQASSGAPVSKQVLYKSVRSSGATTVASAVDFDPATFTITYQGETASALLEKGQVATTEFKMTPYGLNSSMMFDVRQISRQASAFSFPDLGVTSVPLTDLTSAQIIDSNNKPVSQPDAWNIVSQVFSAGMVHRASVVEIPDVTTGQYTVMSLERVQTGTDSDGNAYLEISTVSYAVPKQSTDVPVSNTLLTTTRITNNLKAGYISLVFANSNGGYGSSTLFAADEGMVYFIGYMVETFLFNRSGEFALFATSSSQQQVIFFDADPLTQNTSTSTTNLTNPTGTAVTQSRVNYRTFLDPATLQQIQVAGSLIPSATGSQDIISSDAGDGAGGGAGNSSSTKKRSAETAFTRFDHSKAGSLKKQSAFRSLVASLHAAKRAAAASGQAGSD